MCEIASPNSRIENVYSARADEQVEIDTERATTNFCHRLTFDLYELTLLTTQRIVYYSSPWDTPPKSQSLPAVSSMSQSSG